MGLFPRRERLDFLLGLSSYLSHSLQFLASCEHEQLLDGHIAWRRIIGKYRPRNDQHREGKSAPNDFHE